MRPHSVRAHTPGPWAVTDAAVVRRIDGEIAIPVADVRIPWAVGQTPHKALREQTANARLIAAVPELLEALERVADYLDRCVCAQIAGAEAEADAVHAAIAKADP